MTKNEHRNRTIHQKTQKNYDAILKTAQCGQNLRRKSMKTESKKKLKQKTEEEKPVAKEKSRENTSQKMLGYLTIVTKQIDSTYERIKTDLAPILVEEPVKTVSIEIEEKIEMAEHLPPLFKTVTLELIEIQKAINKIEDILDRVEL